MKILHYSLGIPPYRSGGLTKYSVDLMVEQSLGGHEVSLLYPGQMDLVKKQSIKFEKEFQNISVYELKNPLPIPLLGGIKNPELFVKKVNSKHVYDSFLDLLQPDIIHVHTLMGIHYEFFQAAKNKRIPTIFTTHDYFGICPKVNLIDSSGDICKNFENGSKCVSCNVKAYSTPMIYFMQSHFYKTLKDNTFMKKIRKQKRKNVEKITLNNENLYQHSELANNLSSNKYVDLRKYYIKILNTFNHIHFNSEIAKSEYEKYISSPGRITSITHRDIVDNRVLKKYDGKKPLQIGFLGPLDGYKGFPLLQSSLLEILSRGENNWHLHVYGDDRVVDLEEKETYISFHGRYNHRELKDIFSKIDVLIIPSIWKETFGFIGLEAISHGVPTIVSSYVGFKDIIKDNETGFIFNPNAQELANILDKLIKDRSELIKWNKNLCTYDFKYLIGEHSRSVELIYKNLVGEI